MLEVATTFSGALDSAVESSWIPRQGDAAPNSREHWSVSDSRLGRIPALWTIVSNKPRIAIQRVGMGNKHEELLGCGFTDGSIQKFASVITESRAAAPNGIGDLRR